MTSALHSSPTPRPNFFIVGAMKCGTTSWVDYLSTHPAITFGPEKEPHHFDADLARTRVLTDQQYAALYAGCDEPVVGDSSVFYLYSEVAPKLIFEHCPDARIAIFLRDHVAFLKSYHNHMGYLRAESKPSLEEAWRLSPIRRTEPRATADVGPNCVEPRLLDYQSVARFAPQVQRYYDTFPADRIRVAWMDRWTPDPRAAYVEMLDFLSVEDDGRTEFTAVNLAPAHRSQAAIRLLELARPVVSPLLAPARLLLGGRKLGLYRRLRRMNTKRATPPPLSADFEAELRDFYATDREEIDQIIATAGGVQIPEEQSVAAST